MLPWLAIPWVRLALAAAALAAAGAAGWTLEAWRSSGEIAELRAGLERLKTAHATALLRGMERNTETVAAVADAATKEVANARQDAETFAQRVAGLHAERGRMLDAIAQLAARTAADPPAGPADGSAPATGPGLVLAQLRAGVDGALGDAEELAAAVDDARARGLRCERLYQVAQQALAKP